MTTILTETIACPDPTCPAPARIVDRWTWAPPLARSST
jgi:hypothetical protein